MGFFKNLFRKDSQQSQPKQPSINQLEEKEIEKIQGLEGLPKEMAIALKEWYRKRALNWWRANNKQEAYCDDCNSTLSRNEGYYRPGYLCCEECTDALLVKIVNWEKAVQDPERYFGPNVPENIKRMAQTKQ